MRIVITLMLVFGMLACTSKREKYLEEIQQMEQQVFDTSKLPKPKEMEFLAEMYLEYVKEFPDDTLSPRFMLRAAEMFKFSGKPTKGFALLDSVYMKYPDSKLAPLALLTAALWYDQEARDIARARQKLLIIIEKYPDSEFADDARKMLDLLDKSPEEILEMLKGKETTEQASEL